MSPIKNAENFFHACESAKGWDVCKQYVVEGAAFSGQSDALEGLDTVERYCDWMKSQGTVTFPEATYDLHSCSFDERTRMAMIFGTFHAKHLGEGGPVPPTHKESHSQYVYILTMDENDKIVEMVKVWNSQWSAQHLGWL